MTSTFDSTSEDKSSLGIVTYITIHIQEAAAWEHGKYFGVLNRYLVFRKIVPKWRKNGLLYLR